MREGNEVLADAASPAEQRTELVVPADLGRDVAGGPPVEVCG